MTITIICVSVVAVGTGAGFLYKKLINLFDDDPLFMFDDLKLED